MSYIINAIIYLSSAWLLIYCLSFSAWLWSKKNRPGAVMSGMLALLSVVLLVWKVAIY